MANCTLGFVSTLAAGLLLGACSTTHSSTSSSMTPDEMQAAWTKYATPGEKHKLLEPMVGSFRTASKMRMSADAPWEESTGTCDNRWTLGGRFLETNYRGNFMDMPFEGRGFTGYDNSTGRFTGLWFDSFGTGLMPASTGTVDATGKVFTYTREYRDPITGEWTKAREVTTIKSAKEHVLEMYSETDGQPEYLGMTLTFTRI